MGWVNDKGANAVQKFKKGGTVKDDGPQKGDDWFEKKKALRLKQETESKGAHPTAEVAKKKKTHPAEFAKKKRKEGNPDYLKDWSK